jgi:hypothetical protein
MAIGGVGSFNPAVVITDGSSGGTGGPGTDKDKPVDKSLPPSKEGEGVVTDADGRPVTTPGSADGKKSSEDGDSGSGDGGASGTTGSSGTSGAAGASGVSAVGAPEVVLDLHALVEVEPAAGSGPQTSLSVPQIPPPPTQGNLSTSELIQKVRTEARKTALELIKATAQVIEAQKLEIAAKADAKIKEINENIKKQEEAEEKKKAMDILKYVMYAISALVIAIMAVACVVSAPFSGGATLAVLTAVSAALLIATVCLSEIKNDDGKSAMDMGMEGMAKGFAKMWPNEGPDKAKQNGMIFGAALMAYIQVAMAAVMAVATLGSGTGSAVAFGATAVGRSISSGLQAVSSAVQTGLNVSLKTMETAMKMTKVAMTVTSIIQAASTISSSSVKISAAVDEYKASIGRSKVEELKAMIKMLQTLLDKDMEFIKQLEEVQSKLDQGVATILKNEHDTSLKIADVQQLA